MGRQHIANPLLDNYSEFDPVNLINPYAYAAAGAFDPLSISGCVLWLKADGNVYNRGTTQATDGQTVETWADASASNATVTQSTSDARPTFKANIVNGSKPVLRFTGNTGQDFFECTTNIFSGATAGTCFVVLAQTLDPPTADNSTGPAVGNFGSASGGSPSDHSSWTDGSIYDGFGSTGRKSVGNPSTNLATWHLRSARSATSDYKFFINGTQFYTTGSNTVGFRSSSPYGWIGRAVGTTFFFNGDVAEVLMYNSALGATDREAVEDYLGTKYGITITH
jgi:hypothetical protein